MANPASIFIVDDDRGLLRLLEKALRREGFVTATASSGREAIAWLARNTPDLLLLDLKLQDIEGKELINHLAATTRSVPFIVITGQGDERVAVEMMKRGAMDYLVKDAQFLEFVPEVIRRACQQLQKDKQLAATQVALAESQAQVLAISERERSRFGAELHDGLGQQLTAIELMCHSLREDLRSMGPDLESQMSRICQLLREAISQTRSLAHDLSPVKLGSGRLPEALAELASRITETGRIKCTFHSSASAKIKSDSVAGQLFRIAQESVNNAVKHSQASEVAISLVEKDGVLRLEISDNGQGLPKTPKPRHGIGIEMMKHRASVIGADLEIKSAPSHGLSVICTLRKSAS